MYCFLRKKAPNKISLKNNKQYAISIVVTLVFFKNSSGYLFDALFAYIKRQDKKKITKIKYKQKKIKKQKKREIF